jgi:hypothetical protein
MLNNHYSFALHLSRNLIVGFIFIAGALGVGMSGYHHFEGMAWIDAFENASMILSGMGPVQQLKHPGAQLFAGFYALFCGLGFVGMMVLVFSPLMHHLIRKIHLDEK